MGASDVSQLEPVHCTFGVPDKGQMLDVQYSQTVESGSEVVGLPHHCLSAGQLVLMQDWAFLRRCLVLD